MERQGRGRDRERRADLAGGGPFRTLLHEQAKEGETGLLGEGTKAVEGGLCFHVSKIIKLLALCQAPRARYHRPPLPRFLFLAAPLLLLVFALGAAALELVGLAPDLAPLAARGVARPEGLPGSLSWAAWAFEGVALLALFLLLWGRTPRWWLDGLAAGASAWTFRGPLLVLGVAGLTRLPMAPFWQLARGALVVDLVAALALAVLARFTLGDERGSAR